MLFKIKTRVKCWKIQNCSHGDKRLFTKWIKNAEMKVFSNIFTNLRSLFVSQPNQIIYLVDYHINVAKICQLN